MKLAILRSYNTIAIPLDQFPAGIAVLASAWDEKAKCVRYAEDKSTLTFEIIDSAELLYHNELAALRQQNDKS